MMYVARATMGVTIARDDRLKRESLMLQKDFDHQYVLHKE